MPATVCVAGVRGGRTPWGARHGGGNLPAPTPKVRPPRRPFRSDAGPATRRASEQGVIREDPPGPGDCPDCPDCPDCEALPERLAGPGTLHLWLSSRHSEKKLRAYLGRTRRLSHEDAEDGHLLIHVDGGR